MNLFDPGRRPPPILTSESGSFAQKTFRERIPRIVQDTIQTNDFPPDILEALQSLYDEITTGLITPIRRDAPDRSFWEEHSTEYIGRPWLDVPWYWAESFFYRRILDATRYFQFDELNAWYHRDPYGSQKDAELKPDAGPHSLQTMLERLPQTPEEQFRALLHASVWGNRADLSYNVAQNAPGSLSLELESANLIVDDTARVWDHLIARRGGQIDFICDNAGTELLFDFALADFILHQGLASKVALHLKAHPFFVSDAMIKDAQAALAAVSQSTSSEFQQMARRLQQENAIGHFVFIAHPFWVTSLFFFQMPQDLQVELARASLVIAKGDANYRRLLGDCHWLPMTPFDAVTAYFPAPLVALRTLKAELIVGLKAGQAESIQQQDPAWLTNGQRGVIQSRLPAP